MWPFKRKPTEAQRFAQARVELERARLELERLQLILESIDRDLFGDAADCSNEYSACLQLVLETPSAAAMTLHLMGRAWLNSARLLNSQEARSGDAMTDDSSHGLMTR